MSNEPAAENTQATSSGKRQIILMRHGDAGAYTQPDHERQLTELGRMQAKETASYLRSCYLPDACVVSPYERAQQTLAVDLAVFASQQPQQDISTHIYDYITPSDDARAAINAIGDIADHLNSQRMLVVCHMPIVAEMGALLTGDTPEAFALAEARVYETEVIAADLAVELARYVPEQM